MTGEKIQIRMRIPLSGGRFCVVIFNHGEPVDFAPLHELNVARMAQKSAPLFQKPLKENGAGAPLLHSAPLPSHEWRKPSPSGEFRGPDGTQNGTPKTLREEIAEAREVLANLASSMASMDSQLAPARSEEFAIRERVVGTHKVSNGVTMLDLDRKGDRAPLFASLDSLAKQWGGLKSERKVVFREIKTLEKQIEHLQRLIKKQNEKKRA